MTQQSYTVFMCQPYYSQEVLEILKEKMKIDPQIIHDPVGYCVRKYVEAQKNNLVKGLDKLT